MSRRSHSAFTLLEVLAILLLVAVGLAAVIGLLRSGIRIQTEAQAAATGMATALTVLYDAAPLGGVPMKTHKADLTHLGLVPDSSDANDDGWKLESGSGVLGSGYATTGNAFTGSKDFTISGYINGYWVRRTETSSAADIVDGRARWAFVTVEAYEGNGGRLVAALKRRILRTWANP